MKVISGENVIIRSLNPQINIKFKSGETREVPDEVGKFLIERFPDKIRETKIE